MVSLFLDLASRCLECLHGSGFEEVLENWNSEGKGLPRASHSFPDYVVAVKDLRNGTGLYWSGRGELQSGKRGEGLGIQSQGLPGRY